MARSNRLAAVRRLLRLFPSGFRRRYGDDIERLVADMQAEWRAAGRPVGFRFWLVLAWDAVTGAVAEHGVAAAGRLQSLLRHPGERIRSMLTSVRHALRQLLRQPLYTGIVVLLIGLGIAGNAAVFRLFDGLFLRALPFDEPEQLVDLDVTAPAWNLEFVSVSITDFNDWREDNTTFQSLMAYTTGGGNLEIADQAIRVTTLAATHEIDDVLRLVPTLGRFFTAEEDRPNGAPVVMLSEGFWQQYFGGDPDVLGRTIQSGGLSWEVIGVLPAEARLLGDADAWLPLREDDESSFYLNAIGRLKPGVSVGQAHQELLAIHARHIPERQVNETTSPTVMLLRDRYLGPQRLGGVVLFGAVAIVLLIACGNVAGLMLTRAASRTEELRLRMALGASRGRMMRQLLTESLLLAVAGGALGALLGIWGSSRLVTLLSDQFPPFIVFDLDLRFLGFVTIVTMSVAVLAGLGPALLASRPSGALVGSARTTASTAMRRAMNAVVTIEVGLATVLLLVSGLAIADVRAVGHTDPGFRTDVLTFRVSPDPAVHAEPADRVAFWERYRSRLEAIPGVAHVAVSTIMPLMGHSGWFFHAERDATVASHGEDNVVVLRRWVEPGYFDALGVRLMQGRAFDDFDGRQDGDGVAVVNESFVRSHLGSTTAPIGQRIRVGDEGPWTTIVGVAADTRHYGLDRDSRPAVYEPARQQPSRLSSHVAIRAEGNPVDLIPALRAATRDVDASLPIYDVQLLADRIDTGLVARRSSSWLIAIFSAVALVLATAGLYGVISYGVGQRRRELGIRLALGAQRWTVQRQVITQGLIIVGIGLVLGVGSGWLLSRLASSVLVQPAAAAPVVFTGVIALVSTVTVLANWAPARRAARVDLMSLLRRE